MSRFAVVPAYNEEKNIEEILREAARMGIKTVVVDDGSTDKTFEKCSNNGAIVLRHETNRGKGEAIKTGVEYLVKNHPEFTHIALMDADMQYHPEEALKIFNSLESSGADFVMGHRNWKDVPFRHRMGNFVWRIVFNALFGTDLKDTNCGMMGFSRKGIEKIKANILGGYIVDNSILIGAIRNDLKIDQVSVNVSYRRKSKVVRGVRMVAGVLLYIMREGLKYRLDRKK